MKNALLILFLLAISNSILFSQLPEGFYEETVIQNGFNQPTGLTFDQNGRLYVWEKRGKVWIVEADGTKLPTPLLDISEEVASWGDHGLLGFVLDPDFLVNGRFYCYYYLDRHYYFNFGTPTYDPAATETQVASIGRITRYSADPATNFSTALLDTRKVLVGETYADGFAILHSSHGTGTLLFGEDGTLLAGCGDGSSFIGHDMGGDANEAHATQALADGIITPDQDIGAWKSQSLSVLSGKIIRIDPNTGLGLPSNPFYDANNPAAAQSRIYARGLRNPFRFTIRPNTGVSTVEQGKPGVLFIGDVGGSQWEELNVVTEPGQNFGWPYREAYDHNWHFLNATAPPNPLAPNPLFGNDCNLEYFTYRHLFQTRTSNEDTFFPNPCDSQQAIPETAYPAVETPPVLAWSNMEWNPPARTKIGYYTNNGQWKTTTLDAIDTPIQAETFDGASSIGGLFYEGENFPEEYRGKYFHGDFSADWIKIFDFDENNNIVSIDTFYNSANDIVDMEVNPLDGCIYYIEYDDKIHRICYGGNPRPIAQIDLNQHYGLSPLTVEFDASNSYHLNNSPLTYHWDFGDGNTSTDIAPTHTFNAAANTPKAFDVILTVTDTFATEGVATQIISLNNTPPQVQITSFNDGDLYPTNQSSTLVLRAQVTDNEHLEADMTYEWQTAFHHNTHIHPDQIQDTPIGILQTSAVGCGEEDYWYSVKLKVTDPAGLSSEVEQSVYPYCADDFMTFTPLAAQVNDQTIDLTWGTTFATDSLYFELERGTDYNNLEVINTQTSNGQTGQNTLTYSFSDAQPIIGLSSYRVKITHPDGMYDYSNIVRISYPTPPNIHLFPNPVDDFFNVQISTTKAEHIQFELFTQAGISMRKMTWHTSIGERLDKIINTNELAQGVYFYWVKNGEEEKRGKLVVL